MAEILDQRLGLAGVERPAERFLAILDPAGERIAKLGDDVVGMAGGKVAPDGAR
jgi:hypothetical protein